MEHIICFHNPEEENGYLSNWYLSVHVFYLPTQRERTFFSLNINASWGDIKKALNMFKLNN